MTKKIIPEQKGGLRWPKWRLYANFLHRELVRLWYGKKSVFTLTKGDEENREFWKVFGFIFVGTILEFGMAHGIPPDKMIRRFEGAPEEYEKLIGRVFPFGTWAHEIYWFVRRILGDELASEFLYDFQIAEIIVLAICACGYATDGKLPPYNQGANLRPIEFYEGQPVAPELEERFYGETSLPKT
jgi:hypothetical protein